MDLVIYEYDGKKYDREKVICAYNNCFSIPQKHNTISIGEKLYEVIVNPCFSYEKIQCGCSQKKYFDLRRHYE